MQTFEILIQKFWDDSITKEELGQLKLLLDQNEHQVNAEFHALFRAKLVDGESNMQPGRAEAILQVLKQEIANRDNKAGVVRKLYGQKLWWAAAAAIVICVSVFLLTDRMDYGKNEAVASNVLSPQKKLKRVSNNADTIMSVALADGSLVKLYPNSFISFAEPFTGTRRDINLTGKAYFKVAKDKHRPFTVYANDFSTTALGTAFTVDAKVATKVSVKLFEGKVVIKAPGNNRSNWTDQYLLPDQEFSYDLPSKKITISRFGNTEQLASVNKIKYASPKVSTLQKGSLEFNNDSLQKVLSSLASNFKVKFEYKDADIEGLYFTGTFSKQEEIDSILSIICNINGLVFADIGEQVIAISKSK